MALSLQKRVPTRAQAQGLRRQESRLTVRLLTMESLPMAIRARTEARKEQPRPAAATKESRLTELLESILLVTRQDCCHLILDQLARPALRLVALQKEVPKGLLPLVAEV